MLETEGGDKGRYHVIIIDLINIVNLIKLGIEIPYLGPEGVEI